jgi:hypothetical protein
MLYRSIICFVAIIFGLSGCATTNTKDLERVKREGIPILIEFAYPSAPNSAGGVDVRIDFVNTSSKTFKYVLFTAIPYNKVGDVVQSAVGGKTSASLETVGPYNPGQKNYEPDPWLGGRYSHWPNVWYNNTISCIEITKVELTYMDGSTVSFDGPSIKKLLAESIKNSCAVR